MGWGGELLTAQFLATEVLDSKTLDRTGHENTNERTGLFIDARCPQGAELVRMIMESDHITNLSGEQTATSFLCVAKGVSQSPQPSMNRSVRRMSWMFSSALITKTRGWAWPQ
jgi:hypothetical protein